MTLSEEEIRGRVFQIEKILSEFWIDGLISSYDKQKIMSLFPERILATRDN